MVATPTCIGYQSAIEYWNVAFRQQHLPPGLGTSQTRRSDTKAACAFLLRCDKADPADIARLPPGCELALPLHIMVASEQARTRTGGIVAHVRTSPIPSASLLRIGEGLFVSTPEFAFVQLADRLSLVELIELGFELCGTYSLRPDGTLQSDCPRLSSVAKLQRLVERAPGFRGRKKALRALRYVLEGSASPRETQLAMLLCLPYPLGGYGLPRPELNRRIDLLDKKGRRSRAFCVCDLYWHEHRLNVEYDSAEFHSSPDALAKDSVRRMVLEAAHVTSINVSNAQLRDSGLFNQLARSLARIMGKRLRYRDPQFTRAHLRLRRELGLR